MTRTLMDNTRNQQGCPLHAPRSYVCHFVAIHLFKLDWSCQMVDFSAALTLKLDEWTQKEICAPFLYYFNDLENENGTPCIRHIKLYVFLKPSMNSSWIYCPEIPNFWPSTLPVQSSFYTAEAKMLVTHRRSRVQFPEHCIPLAPPCGHQQSPPPKKKKKKNK